VTEIKANLVRLDGKIDRVESSLETKINALDNKIDGVRDSLSSKIDAVRDSVEALKRGRLEDKLWALLAMATLLGVMARGFHWI
jgi:hypothetical protein